MHSSISNINEDIKNFSKQKKNIDKNKLFTKYRWSCLSYEYLFSPSTIFIEGLPSSEQNLIKSEYAAPHSKRFHWRGPQH